MKAKSALVMLALVMSSGACTANSSAGHALPSPSEGNCANGWKTVSTLSFGSGNIGTSLDAIQVLSGDDIWAAGTVFRLPGRPASPTPTPSLPAPWRRRLVVDHWDGHTWRSYLGPGVGSMDAMSVDSSDEVWIAAKGGRGGRQTVFRFEGGTWSTMMPPHPMPRDWPSGTGLSLNAIAAVSAHDVWAVGMSYNMRLAEAKPVVAHWDGTRWSITRGATSARGVTLLSIWASSGRDIWAVGGNRMTPIAEHYDGRSWSVVPIGGGTLPDNLLYSVSGSSPSDVWAAGVSASLPEGSGWSTQMGQIMQHWNGHAWDPVAFPSLPLRGMMYTVDAVAPDDAWAVGVGPRNPVAPHNSLSVVAHWDGRSWSYGPQPPDPGLAMVASDIAGLPGGGALLTVNLTPTVDGSTTAFVKGSC